MDPFGSGFSPDIRPGVELQGYITALFLVLSGASILFSRVAVPIYIPTNSLVEFPSLYTLSSIYCVWILLMIATLVAHQNSSQFWFAFQCYFALCQALRLNRDLVTLTETNFREIVVRSRRLKAKRVHNYQNNSLIRTNSGYEELRWPN